MLILLTLHIDLLTNAAPAVNVVLVGIVPVTMLAGWIGATVLKKRRPDIYAGIGGVHPEDGHIPPAEPTDDQDVLEAMS